MPQGTAVSAGDMLKGLNQGGKGRRIRDRDGRESVVEQERCKMKRVQRAIDGMMIMTLHFKAK